MRDAASNVVGPRTPLSVAEPNLLVYTLPVGTLLYHGTEFDYGDAVLDRSNFFANPATANKYQYNSANGHLYEYVVHRKVVLLALDQTDCRVSNNRLPGTTAPRCGDSPTSLLQRPPNRSWRTRKCAGNCWHPLTVPTIQKKGVRNQYGPASTAVTGASSRNCA